jgi:probable HAF family extracellular repeat protein
MRFEFRFAAALFLLGALAISVRASLQYAFYPGANFPGQFITTVPLGASNTQIVGDTQGPNWLHAYIQMSPAFLPTGPARFLTAEPSGAVTSYLSGINRYGVAVGGYCSPGCNPESGQQGYIYNSKNGEITKISYPGANSSTAYGINNKGEIVGGFCTYIVCPVNIFTLANHGYLYSNGSFTQLDFPGSQLTEAFSINDAGVIIGDYQINSTSPHAFIYQNGVYTNIDYPGTNNGFVSAINNSGLVAGIFVDPFGRTHGYTYQNGQFTQIDDPTGLATQVTAVNDKGYLVGYVNMTIGTAPFVGIPQHLSASILKK